MLLAVNCQAGSVVLVQPSLQVSEEYTDNVYLDDEYKESDFITVISPQISISRNTKISEMQFQYAPAVSLYANNSEYNTLRHSLNGVYSRQLGKQTTLSIRDTFTRSEEPYSPSDYSPTQADEQIAPEYRYDTTREEREPRSVNVLSLGLDHDYGPQNSVSLHYSLGHVWEESEDEEDSTRNTVRAAVTHWFTHQWGTEVSAGYTRGEFSGESDTYDEWKGNVSLKHAFTKHLTGFIDYAQTVVDYHGDDADYEVYDPGVGVDWVFAQDAYASLRIGYSIRDEDGEDLETGLNFDADIGKSWQLTRRAAFRVSGGRGYEQTSFGGENLGYTEYTQARAALSYALAKFTDSSLSLSYRRNKYTDEDPERRDNVYSFTGGVSHLLTKSIAAGLSYTYRMVDSNINEEEYTENRVMLSLTFTPQGWKF
jgi:hypothetical protein